MGYGDSINFVCTVTLDDGSSHTENVSAIDTNEAITKVSLRQVRPVISVVAIPDQTIVT